MNISDQHYDTLLKEREKLEQIMFVLWHLGKADQMNEILAGLDTGEVRCRLEILDIWNRTGWKSFDRERT